MSDTETYESWKKRVMLHCGAVSFAGAKDGDRIYMAAAYDKDFEKVGNWSDKPLFPKPNDHKE